MVREAKFWYPDTCECVVGRSEESTEPDGRESRFEFMGRLCAVHTAISVPADVYATVQEECKRKEDVRAFAKARKGTFADVDFDFSFTGTGTSRVLTVRLRGITATQRTQIQADADAFFGVGRVVVVRV